jgi:hypothetical protein
MFDKINQCISRCPRQLIFFKEFISNSKPYLNKEICGKQVYTHHNIVFVMGNVFILTFNLKKLFGYKMKLESPY